MRQFVQQLHLAQHVGPVSAPLIHLQHHYVTGRPMCHLEVDTKMEVISKGGFSTMRDDLVVCRF